MLWQIILLLIILLHCRRLSYNNNKGVSFPLIGVEINCNGHYRLLFSLLRVRESREMQRVVLEVISCVTGSKECVGDIAESGVLGYLLISLELLPEGRPLALESLQALVSHTRIVKDLLACGAPLYLLDLFCNCRESESVREKTAELSSKMMADKLHGPKVRIMLGRFLPAIFLDAMVDSPTRSVTMFETVHENPELIWNEQSRQTVCRTVQEMKAELFECHMREPTATWRMPERFCVPYESVEGELVVGGVFLRLFVANPGWVVRRPREFLVELLDRLATLITPDDTTADATADGSSSVMELVTQACVGLLSQQAALCDTVPSLGYLPQILAGLKSKREEVTGSCVRIVHCLCNSKVGGGRFVVVARDTS